jgi:hypothetical protein
MKFFQYKWSKTLNLSFTLRIKNTTIFFSLIPAVRFSNNGIYIMSETNIDLQHKPVGDYWLLYFLVFGVGITALYDKRKRVNTAVTRN